MNRFIVALGVVLVTQLGCSALVDLPMKDTSSIDTGVDPADATDPLVDPVDGDPLPDTDADPDVDTDLDPDTTLDPDVDIDPEPDTTVDPDVDFDPDPDTTVDPDVDPDSLSDPDTLLDPDLDADIDPDPDTAVDPDPDTLIDPDPDTTVDSIPDTSIDTVVDTAIDTSIDVPVDDGPVTCTGCWVDPTSGLEWEDPPLAAALLNWDAAVSYCDSLSLNGHGPGEWRLPTISELRTLVRGCHTTEDGGDCGVTDTCLYEYCRNAYCNGCGPVYSGPGVGGCFWDPALEGTCGSTRWHWSSSSHADYPTTGAFLVAFAYGAVSYATKDQGGNARCVRTP